MRVVSIDAESGDFGSSVTVPSALNVLKSHPDVKMIFVGRPESTLPLLEKYGDDLSDRWEFQPACEVVAMDESPSVALRSKKDSSMRVAINMVKEGRAHACVSAGNTGALMAIARFVLKTLPLVDRPAILARFPTKGSHDVRVLDLGANVDSAPHHLLQFAVMGSVTAEAVDNISNPTVGLLNVGEEDIKGNEQVKSTALLLSQCSDINYIGYVEGNDLFRGTADIIVCDGFVGNVVLKACEGILKFVSDVAKQEMKKSWLSRLSILPALPLLKRLKHHIDPRTKNGASFLGLNGTVIKSHGGADQVAFGYAVERAISETEKHVPSLIGRRVEHILNCTNDPA